MNDADLVSKAIDLLSDKTCNTCEFCFNFILSRPVCVRNHLSDELVDFLKYPTTCKMWAPRSEFMETTNKECEPSVGDLVQVGPILKMRKNLIKMETDL